MVAASPSPTVLTGRFVRLEPLGPEHVPDLFAAGGNDEEVWQQAILRLGAQREGVWRRHRLRSDGVTWRDSVFFSLLADEWPDAKARLRARLEG